MTKGEIQLMIDTEQKELNYYIKHRDILQKSAKGYDLRIKATQDKINKWKAKQKEYEESEVLGNGFTNSNGVNWSNGVNRSFGVFNSYGVNRSYGVNESSGVNWSFGVFNSYGVDNALFLADKPRTYTIFGVDVEKERYYQVRETLEKKLHGWVPMFHKEHAWKDMPQDAIDYVKSLPEFNAVMFYVITGINV